MPDNASTREPLLAVRDLTLVHPESNVPAVNHVSFDVAAGEIYALLGPSGAGKTTILRLLAGFEVPETGTVSMRGELLSGRGKMVPPEKRHIGFVFQEFALFPHLSVEENVCFGIRVGSGPRAHAHEEVKACGRDLLERMQIEPLSARMPSRLSGGEQQRVALARSLAPRPPLLLLDEPFSSLDADLRGTIRSEVRGYLKKHDMAAIIVTHDQEEALAFADRVAVMRDGRIVQEGPAEELYKTPKNAYVAHFLGGCNVLEGEATGDRAMTAIGEVMLTTEATGSVRIALRPEHLAIETASGRTSDTIADAGADTHGNAGSEGVPSHSLATVLQRDFHGHDITYRVMARGVTLIVKSGYDASWRTGDTVRLIAREKGVVVE